MNNIEKLKEYPLTYTLMAISIVAFIVEQSSQALNDYFYNNFVLHGFSVVVKEEFFRLVTSIFLHSDGMHIVMNMVSLYIVGTMVEKLFTKFAYLSIYFIAAFFGSFAAIYMNLGGIAVGASGAIFGLFGALAGFAFVHRKTMKDQFVAFMKNFGVILVINLVIGFVFPSISISAHVGGLLAGVIGGLIIAKNAKYIWFYLAASMILFVFIYDYLLFLYFTT